MRKKWHIFFVLTLLTLAERLWRLSLLTFIVRSIYIIEGCNR